MSIQDRSTRNPTVPLAEVEDLLLRLEQAHARKDWAEVASLIEWQNHNARAREHHRLRAVQGGGR